MLRGGKYMGASTARSTAAEHVAGGELLGFPVKACPSRSAHGMCDLPLASDAGRQH